MSSEVAFFCLWNLKWEPRGTYWEPTKNPEKHLGNHRGIVGEINETIKETKVFYNSSSFVLPEMLKTDFP